MKRILMVLLIGCTISSCGQKTNTNTISNKEEKNMISNIDSSKKDVTASNIVDVIHSQVKHFEKEPRYFIRPTQSNCVFEILINDMLVYEEFGIETIGTPIDINSVILNSGPQTVTIRMYPLGEAVKRAYGDGETVTTLLPKTEMKISVVKYEAFNISKDLDDEILVKEHKSPTKDGTNEFIGAGLPYFEYIFTFNAEVPYSIEGWSNGQDLTKLDKDELEQQVLSYYNKMKSIYMNENKDALAKSWYGDMLVIARSLYSSKEEIQEMWNETLRELQYENKDVQPFKNYEMSFYGEGKIVSLRHPSKEPVDRRLRGRSAFWFKYETATSIRVFFPFIDLYLPKGEPLENLRRIGE